MAKKKHTEGETSAPANPSKSKAAPNDKDTTVVENDQLLALAEDASEPEPKAAGHKKPKKVLTRLEQGDQIIRSHTGWAVVAGLIPLPLVDSFAVGAIQTDMLKKLSALYGVDFSEDQNKANITMLAGVGFARMFTRFAKAIPVVGTIVGGVSRAVTSGASTYAVGEVFQRHYESGGTLLEGLDIDVLKMWYNDALERGKAIAAALYERYKPRTKAELGREAAMTHLKSLHDIGFLTAHEYEELVEGLAK